MRLEALKKEGQVVEFDLLDETGRIGQIEIRVDQGAIYIVVGRIDESRTGPVALEVV